MTVKQWLPLIGLACSAFVFNSSEFMPVGLLTDIADTFGLTDAEAGVMITVYAWAVALLSLPLMILASRIAFRPLILGIIAVFALGQLLSAVAPTYFVLVLARLIVASAHAVFWSVASIMGTRIAGVRHGALALSIIATGSSIAMIFGLPIGRVIGLMVGWRMTFVCVAAVSCAILVYLAVVFPRLEAGEPFTLERLPMLVGNRLLVCMYAVTVLFATGYYTGYSYIEPFLLQIGAMPSGVITGVLTVFGVAGLAGSLLFTRFYDLHRRPFIAASVAGVVCALLALQTAALGGVVAVAVTFVVWGMSGTVFNIAFQAELIRHVDADDSAVAMSIFSGLFNFGIGAGSALGGAVTTVSLAGIGYVGGAIVLAGLLLCCMTVLRRLRRG